MSRSERELLVEALAHFDLLVRHASGDIDDQLVIDAVCMRLSAGLEVLGRIGGDRRAALFGDDWTLMWGMRNRIAHGYLLVDPEIIRRTLEADIPVIVGRLRAAVAER